MTGKLPGPTRDRYGPIMEMRVALLRAGGLSTYQIALALKLRRESVERILKRPHVAALVEKFRKGLRAHGLLWTGALVVGLNPDGISSRSYPLFSGSPTRD